MSFVLGIIVDITILGLIVWGIVKRRTTKGKLAVVAGIVMFILLAIFDPGMREAYRIGHERGYNAVQGSHNQD